MQGVCTCWRRTLGYRGRYKNTLSRSWIPFENVKFEQYVSRRLVFTVQLCLFEIWS